MPSCRPMCGCASRSISNLLGLHVISGGPGVSERLAAYSNAIAARSDGLAGASERAASLLVQAVRNQANVLSYRDGFTIVSIAVIAMLVLDRAAAPRTEPGLSDHRAAAASFFRSACGRAP